MEEIIRIVSKFTDVPVSDIKSRNRTRKVCEARQIFMYLSYTVYGRTISSIADYLGGRTHQNVSSQLLCFGQQLKIYKGLKKRVDEIKNGVL
jgi:chromosomal replication initiation ATPase DnaA